MKPSEYIEDREIEVNEEGYDLRLKEGTLKDLDKNFISKVQHQKELEKQYKSMKEDKKLYGERKNKHIEHLKEENQKLKKKLSDLKESFCDNIYYLGSEVNKKLKEKKNKR